MFTCLAALVLGGCKGGEGARLAADGEPAGGASKARVETIAGIEMKIFVPEGAGPFDLTVFTHGDDSTWVHEDEDFGAMLTWSGEHRAVFVSMQSPNKYSWWSTASTVESATDYSGEFQQALEWLRANLSLKTDRFYYSGASGGSTFATNYLIPRIGSTHKAVYALACGGWVQETTSIEGVDKTGNVLRFAYGTEDFMFKEGDIGAAIDLYTKAGWDVSKKEIQGAKHCRSELDQDIAEIWGANVR